VADLCVPRSGVGKRRMRHMKRRTFLRHTIEHLFYVPFLSRIFRESTVFVPPE